MCVTNFNKDMKHYIYALKEPINNSIIYIGQTIGSVEHRVDSHYWKLNEVKRGERNWTSLFKFLDDLLPKRVYGIIIKEVDDTKPFNSPDFLERYYIKKYREQGCNLLNEADGGIGGNTYKHKTSLQIEEIGKKISLRLKGKPKPPGFAEHLREIRSGANNPMARKLERPIAAYKGIELIKVFHYKYEIDEFVGKKGACSNVDKVLSGKIKYRPYGYSWKYLEKLKI